MAGERWPGGIWEARSAQPACSRRLLAAGAGILAMALLGAPASIAEDDRWEAFDHFRTRFPLVDAHKRVACEECHRGGVFEGTPMRCALCHDGSGFRAQTAKDIGHIRSTNDCGDCHLMNAWVPSRVDHGSVRGSCFTCHNGADAEGKNPNHVVSSNDCELCHTTSRWTGARFDHFGITARCITCHNNVTQPGKPGDHVASTDECEDCHNTRNWENASFDHSSITARCDSCHQKNPGHIASSNDCEICHNTRDWEDAQFDHSSITANCASCHTGDLPSGHFMSAEDCSECHQTTRWSPSTFRHSTPDYPGDHAGNPNCRACHQANSDIVQWPRAEFRPDCAGCHAADFERRNHRNKLTGLRYTTSELRDCTSACHVEDDGRPEHRVSDREW